MIILLNTHQLQIWFAEKQTNASFGKCFTQNYTSAVSIQAARSTHKLDIFFPQTFVHEFFLHVFCFVPLLLFLKCVCADFVIGFQTVSSAP
jgi:patatin-like phospholipase/acyl hydrolase